MRLSVVLSLLVCANAFAAEYAPIPRVLPPPGIEIPAEKREAWTAEITALRKRLTATKADANAAADVEVFLKAVSFAIDLGEFYTPKDFAKADNLLKVARERMDALEKGQRPWTTAKGLIVRGFVSQVDGSIQPYGLVIPEEVELAKREVRGVPLYVFLHGRGDKQTDLHFLEERLRSKGEVHPPAAIVLHPFGRQCVGYKSAGETDVLEAIAHVQQNYYPIDSNKIVMMGFSMGGAGAWHLGSHYANRWAVVAPGAGFAETARYTKSDPAKVPWYEQTLWGCYDAPCYVRNLFNTKTIAYSGENDKQIQAARVMEEAFQAEGTTLDHRIGPGVEHKYEPTTLQKLLADIAAHLSDVGRRDPADYLYPDTDWQGRTLRYAAPSRKPDPLVTVVGSYQILALEEHWLDSRLTRKSRRSVIETKNIRAFSDSLPRDSRDEVKIDGQAVKIPAEWKDKPLVTFVKGETSWKVGEFPPDTGPHKIPGLQGPIDDAFLEPFLIVTPSGKSPHAAFDRWVQFELKHFRERWKALMRGDPRVKADKDVTAEDLKKYHVIVWGDPDSNTLLARWKDNLPVKYSRDEFVMRDKSYSRNDNAPVLIYPNAFADKKYVVLNSGLTFREAHDKTNSQQNPKLPDWAVVDLSEPPSASAPGKIADAGFFDEEWRFKQKENRGP